MPVFAILQNLLADVFECDPAEITRDTDVYADLGADSLDMAELAYACEEEFDLVTPKKTDALWKLKTVGEITEFICVYGKIDDETGRKN